MKAARFHEYGNIDQLVVEDVPDPTAGPGTVVIKVGGCALNHLDVDLREGISRFPMELPHILGLEVAGEIVEVGPGVPRYQCCPLLYYTFLLPTNQKTVQ